MQLLAETERTKKRILYGEHCGKRSQAGARGMIAADRSRALLGAMVINLTILDPEGYQPESKGYQPGSRFINNFWIPMVIIQTL